MVGSTHFSFLYLSLDDVGVTSDFQGPYYVGDDGRMAFGAPTRYFRIDISKHITPSNTATTSSTTIAENGREHDDASQIWDDSIQAANAVYRGRMHNICCDNCHSHVANALNRLPPAIASSYVYSTQWNMVNIATLMFFRGHFRSWSAVWVQFGPCLVLVAVIVLATKLT
jgi:transmembrane protein 222